MRTITIVRPSGKLTLPYVSRIIYKTYPFVLAWVKTGGLAAEERSGRPKYLIDPIVLQDFLKKQGINLVFNDNGNTSKSPPENKREAKEVKEVKQNTEYSPRFINPKIEAMGSGPESPTNPQRLLNERINPPRDQIDVVDRHIFDALQYLQRIDWYIQFARTELFFLIIWRTSPGEKSEKIEEIIGKVKAKVLSQLSGKHHQLEDIVLHSRGLRRISVEAENLQDISNQIRAIYNEICPLTDLAKSPEEREKMLTFVMDRAKERILGSLNEYL
ncbi:MAG: hypothetical protein PHG23_02755 [Candidatus Pacebacteria bacterium]|nr:hypothetical protein [Candidatus Paceibacterota bacterium]